MRLEYLTRMSPVSDRSDPKHINLIGLEFMILGKFYLTEKDISSDSLLSPKLVDAVTTK